MADKESHRSSRPNRHGALACGGGTVAGEC